jgi:hypothetical protein
MLICIFAFSVIIYGISYFARASEPSDLLQVSEVYHAEALKCGRNSLFMFLVLSGHSEVTIDQLSSLSGTEEGISLSDICKMARRYNVSSEVRHYSADEVGYIPLPAIIQLEFIGSDSTRTLHFVVPYKVNSEGIFVLDGTTGFKSYIPRAKFTRLWTGYAMVGKRSFLSHLIEGRTAWILIGFLLIMNGAIVWSRVCQIKNNSGVKVPQRQREVPV